MADDIRKTAHSRTVAHFIAEFMLRAAESVSRQFENDYEAAILFLAISTRNTQIVMNDPVLRQKYGSYSTRIPLDLSTPVSRLALARSTGLPRETVRRKVAYLIKREFVVEDSKKMLRVNPKLNEAADYVEVLKPQAQNLRRLFSVLASTGLFNEN